MDKPISVGDLVQVVSWPCCGIELGKIFIVASLEAHDNLWRCATCMRRHPAGLFALDAQNHCGAILPWLKRIPPYNQLEHFRSQELLRRDVKELA